jgi:hypothetical protein
MSDPLQEAYRIIAIISQERDEWKARAEKAEAALRAVLDPTPEQRQNPAVWFPLLDAARAILKEQGK